MSSPNLTDVEREAVIAVLNTPYLSMGKEILAFEKAVMEYTGSAYAIAVHSGTAGLHLCVRAAGIKDDDLVITTPFSFVASANVALFERAYPIFVDIDPITGNLDPSLVRAAVNDIIRGGTAIQKWLPRKGINQIGQLKAILPVDVYGQPADLDPILDIANEFGLSVIEDSCEALGATYKGRQAGTLGDFGVFGFYPNKQITTGEGGMVITNNREAANLMRALRNQGREETDTWMQHTLLGYNYRLDEMSAVLGKVQMDRLDEMLANREQVANWYNNRIAKISGVESPKIVSQTTKMSWFVYVIRFSSKEIREKVKFELIERDIPVRQYFLPIHLQPYMIENFGFQVGDFPITENISQRSLALPFSSVMKEEQVNRVCTTISNILTRTSRNQK